MPGIQQNKYYPIALYTVGLAIILSLINYFGYLLYPATGLHFWRQTDSLSFVAYYYENGMRFFEPGTYNIQSEGGHAVAEFPILYYITAELWHIFGRHDYILKVLNSLIVFAGFYCLFKIAIKYIGNIYTALAVTFLLLSSSVLLFYTNNFLPDPPALGLTLIGAHFFFQFIQLQQYKHYVLAFVLFTISVLIKVNMLVFPLAIMALVIIEKVFKLNLQTKPVFSGKAVKYILPPLIMLLCIVLWVLWAKNYNQTYNSNLFLTSIQPYWNCTPEQIEHTRYAVLNYWYGQYYFYTTWHVFYIILIAGVIALRSWNKTTLWLSLLLIAGSFAYGLFFFKQFAEHDYYIFPFFIPLAFAVIFSISSLSNRLPAFKSSIIPCIALFIIAGLSFNYVGVKLASRNNIHNIINPEILEISGCLEDLGIPKSAEIISIPDDTPNGTLYYLQRKGLTNWADYSLDKTRQFIAAKANTGIKYMVITNPAYYVLAEDSLYFSEQIDSYKHIKIYKIAGLNATK